MRGNCAAGPALIALVASLGGCAEEPTVMAAQPAKTAVASGASARQAPAQPAESAAPRASPARDAHAPEPGARPSETRQASTKRAGADEKGARLYAKARFAWIRPAPGGSAWTGYLGLGGSVRLRGGSEASARIAGSSPSCDAWYAVEPSGFVCAGATASLDPADPVVVALAADAPDVGSPWPYHYGESIERVPRYPRVPTEAEQHRTEPDLASHLARMRRAREGGAEGAVDPAVAGLDLRPSGVPTPSLLDLGPAVRESRPAVARASTVAWTREFDVGERTFLLASDHALMPKDRVRPYPRSSYQGVALGEGARLPLAFFRKTARPKYRRDDDGSFVPTGESWPARSWVGLTGEEVGKGRKRHLATVEPGIFAQQADASVVTLAKRIPFDDEREGDDRTWLDVSVLGGWLVAYEGRKPVYATLVSPGRGGVPVEGRDPLETASTPTGTFRIDGKFRTAMMVSSTNSSIVHSEVMFVQNFSGPHALHGAYWHDEWGEPKSGGCVNLSPLDARWLFEWSEPRMPEGWHGLRSVSELGRATVVVIHR